MMEVAVIGAGAAGLVASRHLLNQGLRPCIFEAAKTVGGAWSSSSSSTSTSTSTTSTQSSTSSPSQDSSSTGTKRNDGFGPHNGRHGIRQSSPMWNGLHTNLSKHTCRFSEWPWPDDTPTFPSALDMDEYLTSYANEFVLNDPDCMTQFSCQVLHIEPLFDILDDSNVAITNNDNKDGVLSGGEGSVDDDSINTNKIGYKVEWIDLTTQTKSSKEFDAIVIASGFFSKPNFPNHILPKKGQIIHSSEYGSSMTSKDDTTDNTNKNASTDGDNIIQKDDTVLVVGSSFSALEIATDVSKTAKQVISLLPTIPYVVPRFLPVKVGSTIPSSSSSSVTAAAASSSSSTSSLMLLPIDVAFYRRSRPFPQPNEKIYISPEECQERHVKLQSMLWGKRSTSTPATFFPSLWNPLTDMTGTTTPDTTIDINQPPKVVVSDHYLDFARSSRMQSTTGTGTSRPPAFKVIQGRLQHVDDNESSSSSYTLEVTISSSSSRKDNDDDNNNNKKLRKEYVDKVICCTGYKPNLEEFVDDKILNILQYQSDNLFCPIIASWDTIHTKVPNFTFCGMYRGPYMGIMELQGRLIAKVLSRQRKKNINDSNEQNATSINSWKNIQQNAMKDSKQIRQQYESSTFQSLFPHFDYVGYMDSLTMALSALDDDDIHNDDKNNKNNEDDVDVTTFPKYNRNVGDFVSPATYQNSNDSFARDVDMGRLLSTEEQNYQSERIPSMVLSAIIGSWDFDRTLVQQQTRQIQRVYGTVQFTRNWSSSSTDDNEKEQSDDDDKEQTPIISLNKSDNDKNDANVIDSYVNYREDGFFELSPTKTLNVFREYDYLISRDALEIYFIEQGRRAHMFLSLKFNPVSSSSSFTENKMIQQKGKKDANDDDDDDDDVTYWIATSDHLCIKDLYKAEFTIKMNGLIAKEIVMKYRVKGPAKDYESTTVLTPKK